MDGPRDFNADDPFFDFQTDSLSPSQLKPEEELYMGPGSKDLLGDGGGPIPELESLHSRSPSSDIGLSLPPLSRTPEADGDVSQQPRKRRRVPRSEQVNENTGYNASWTSSNIGPQMEQWVHSFRNPGPTGNPSVKGSGDAAQLIPLPPGVGAPELPAFLSYMPSQPPGVPAQAPAAPPVAARPRLVPPSASFLPEPNMDALRRTRGRLTREENKRINAFIDAIQEGKVTVAKGELARALQTSVNPNRKLESYEKLVSRRGLNKMLSQYLTKRRAKGHAAESSKQAASAEPNSAPLLQPLPTEQPAEATGQPFNALAVPNLDFARGGSVPGSGAQALAIPELPATDKPSGAVYTSLPSIPTGNAQHQMPQGEGHMPGGMVQFSQSWSGNPQVVYMPVFSHHNVMFSQPMWK